jgi:hypothetical protein
LLRDADGRDVPDGTTNNLAERFDLRDESARRGMIRKRDRLPSR